MEKKKEDELIPRAAYIQDIKNRWKIHTKEFIEFIEDIKKFINFSKPYVNKVIEDVGNYFQRVKKNFKNL